MTAIRPPCGLGETGIAVGYEKMRDAEGKMDGKLVGKVLGYYSHPDERPGKVFVANASMRSAMPRCGCGRLEM